MYLPDAFCLYRLPGWLRDSGLDHTVIDTLCNRFSNEAYRVMAEACPQVRGSLQFRSAPDGACIEEWALVG